MKKTRSIVNMIMVSGAILAACVLPARAGEIKVSYLYKLSNFTGVIPYGSPRISVDKTRNEVYVLSGEGVSVFNSTGMEIFRVDSDPEFGMVYDLAVAGDGNVITLTYKGGKPAITLCNYRMEPLRAIELVNLPPEYAAFRPTQLKYRDGRIYLVNNEMLTVLVTDLEGRFLKGYALGPLLGDDDKGHAITDMDGFNLDGEGNMIFVLPMTGSACRLTPDGILTRFGKRGSGAGRFGVPGWIVADKAGNYLVADKVRRIILIFDKELKFVSEFNSAGVSEAYLAGPTVMDTDGDGKLYVGQVPRKGINVYRLVSNG